MATRLSALDAAKVAAKFSSSARTHLHHALAFSCRTCIADSLALLYRLWMLPKRP